MPVDKIASLGPWFHNIHLPDGRQTNPDHFYGDFPSFKWERIKQAIPQDLTGWNVLDIGCNAGFYSIELARRGASVLAIDLDEHYLAQAKWVAKQFELEDRIEFRKMQVYDLAKEEASFDLVWFMGVFYHLRYPLLALDIVSQKTRNMLVFQTLSMPGKSALAQIENIPIEDRSVMLEPGYPLMAFLEKSLGGNYSNWWAPNHACILAMLRSCGFRLVSTPEDETYISVKDTGIFTDFDTWNYSEYLSATGQGWEALEKFKTGNKR